MVLLFIAHTRHIVYIHIIQYLSADIHVYQYMYITHAIFSHVVCNHINSTCIQNTNMIYAWPIMPIKQIMIQKNATKTA